MTTKETDSRNTPLAANTGPLDHVRSILLSDVRERLIEIEREIASVQDRSTLEDEELRRRLDACLADLDRLHALMRETESRSRDLQTEIEILSRKAKADSEGLIARVSPVLSDMIGRTIRDSRDEMAEALGPVMGEAIRVQIRDSRKDMVEALYPVIGETVQKAVGEFARELQRNIDSRLRSTFGPQGFLRTLTARLRGVSPSRLALRDALPFAIKQIFLIQHHSGLLLAHHSDTDTIDSDLISGMLTAIRDFVRDSFGNGSHEEELDEVQYGENRIIIQSGRAAYLAVVITGVEPEGFHARLKSFVSELHVRYEKTLLNFNGDPTTLPNLRPKITRLIEETTRDEPHPMQMSRAMKAGMFMAAIVVVLFIALACFYLQFTMALYPIAFPSATPTSTGTPTSTPTFTPLPTSTGTYTATATFTPTNTFTPTFTFTPSATPTPYTAFAAGNVWVRRVPEYDAARIEVLYLGTPVTVFAVYGPWLEVEWLAADGLHRGWVPGIWVTLVEPVDTSLVTPTIIP
jgi:hypothetical protein